MAYNLGGGAYGRALSGIGQNLGQGMQNITAMLMAKQQQKQTAYFDRLEQNLAPTIGYVDGKLTLNRDVDDKGKLINYNVKTLPEAWKEYKQLTGTKARPAEFSEFKKKYLALMEAAGPYLAQQFENMEAHGIKKSTIRRFLNENPDLSLGLTKYGMINPAIGQQLNEYMNPSGIVPGIGAEIGGIATAGYGVPAIRGAGMAYKGFTGAAAGEGLGAAGKGFGKGIMPGRAFAKATMTKGLEKRGVSTLAKDLSKAGWNPGVDKVKSRATRAEKALTAAKEKFKTEKRAYEYGKGKKRLKTKTGGVKRFDSTKAAKKLRAQKERLKKLTSKRYGVGYQKKIGQKFNTKVIGNYIKKHGMGKLMGEISKKVSKKEALKLGARLIGGGALTLTGVGAGVGLAMDALAVYQIGKILYDVVQEESGITQRKGLDKFDPRKVLFGGGKSTKLEKTTF